MPTLDEIDAERARREYQAAEADADAQRAAHGEELADEAARLQQSLPAFIRAAWHVLEPATVFKANWHIDAIAEHVQAAYDRDISRLLINVPPGSMKSLIVSVFGPAWQWCSTPQERFLTASHVERIAMRDSNKTRRLISSPWYLARWGHVFRLMPDQNTKTRFDNDRSGYRVAITAGSGIGERGTVIQLDDPHNADDVGSAVVREGVLQWHDETISGRFSDPVTGVEIIIMQRLHEADLSGHVLEQGGWTHLCLPTEWEPSLVVQLPSGAKYDAACPPTRELPSGRVLPGDPRTRPGELLHPAHNPPETHKRDKLVKGSYVAAGQLQQRPAPAEGGILKTAWWRYYPPAEQADGSEDWGHMPRWQRLIQSWDTALKAKTTSDFTAGSLWGIAGANRYLLRVARGHWNLAETKTQLRLMTDWALERWPAVGMTIVVENAANGPEVIAQMRDEIPGIVPFNPTTDKVQRAHSVVPQLEAGNVFVPGRGRSDGTGYEPALTPAWVQSLIDECAAFDNAAHDDQVDSVTMALIRAGVPAERAAQAHAEDDVRGRRAISAGVMTQTF